MDFSNLNVLVIGDVALDVYEEGNSNRLSPEAPVPVILNPTERYSLGMAANVFSNLNNLNASVDIIFAYGEDYYGKIFSKLMESEFSNTHIRTINNIEGNTSTVVKKRILANGNQVARIDFENGIDKKDIDATINSLNDIINMGKYYDFIVISDYNKGIITKESWKEIRPLLEQLSDTFYVDTKKLDVLNYYEGMYIFPNKKEMEEIMTFNNCNTRNELRIEMDLDFIIETASEEGAILYKNDGKILHSPAVNLNIIDVTGAGDTFIAAFSLFYTKFKNKMKALDFANYCCSKVVSKKGTEPIYLHEVEDFLRKC